MSEFTMRVEEPPPKARGCHGRHKHPAPKLKAALEFVQANPGQWCAVDQSASMHTAANLACNWRRRLAQEGYEFQCRAVMDDGKKVYRVYCRYTPPANTEVA